MPDYKLKNGKVVSQSQLEELAKKRNTTIQDIISKNGLVAIKAPKVVKKKGPASVEKNVVPQNNMVSSSETGSSASYVVPDVTIKQPKYSLVYKDSVVDFEDDIKIGSSGNAKRIVNQYKKLLEQDGFEVNNTPDTLFIKAPNGQNTSFDVTTGFNRFNSLNNWIAENSDEQRQAKNPDTHNKKTYKQKKK